jgi:hypothetical protein
MIAKIVLALCACWAGRALAAAEIVYVTDSLRLGLHHADDTSDAPFQNLLSGAALEVLERTSNFAHVRTEDGQEGWVKTTYLVAQKPAVRRVAELEAELESMRAELNAPRHLPADTSDIPAARESTDGAAAAVSDLRVENARLEASLDEFRGSLPLGWVLGALVVVAAGGFLSGLWWLDSLIRRRHGGFRVY